MSEATHTRNFSPTWTSAPGETIADLLDEQGWSQAEFAERAGYTPKHVSLLLNGKAAITEDTAFRLERVLGANAQFWLTREAQYRETLAREHQTANLRQHEHWLRELPLAHMIRHGWVTKHFDKAAQVSACLSYFGVASVEAWRKRYIGPLAAFRASDKFQKNPGAVAAWLRYGERCAMSLKCEPFDRQAFRDELTALRALTNESDPSVFVPRLVQVCAQAGVAVVMAPAPRGCPIYGATQWLAPDKALLMLSLRYRSNDHLWFAFFHEAAHLLLHGKKMLFLETSGLDSKSEKEADEFAEDLLIPEDSAALLHLLPKTKAAVRQFAQQIGIAPGIVVGRMQHDRHLPPNFLNDLKCRYTWE